MPKLTTSEVQAILKGEKSDALSAAESSKLSEERARALDYYQGDMARDMPAPADRSKAVSSDVADAVEGLMPPVRFFDLMHAQHGSLLVAFASGWLRPISFS